MQLATVVAKLAKVGWLGRGWSLSTLIPCWLSDNSWRCCPVEHTTKQHGSYISMCTCVLELVVRQHRVLLVSCSLAAEPQARWPGWSIATVC